MREEGMMPCIIVSNSTDTSRTTTLHRNATNVGMVF